MTAVDTVIVGGGPAGAAVACGLAAARREVVLLERTGEAHHKVCGEFLSIETQTHLARFGIDAAALGAAPIERVALYSATRHVDTVLPFRGLSLSRFRLDAALLGSARRLGADVRRGVAVRSVAAGADTWAVQCSDGQTLTCRNLVLATGKTGIRGVAEARDGAMVGLKLHLQPSSGVRRALDGRVELSFFDRSYVGLELVEQGIANLCFLLPRATVARTGSNWPALRAHLVAVMPGLAERLEGATPLWDKPLAVVCPAGGYLHREADPAAYRVGDRLAHIPPFTGDGLAVALTSAALAVDHIRRGLPPATYRAAAGRLVGGPVHVAGILAGLAGSRLGRNLLMAAASYAPALVATAARRTRMPPISSGPSLSGADPADGRLANAGSRR